MKNATVSDRPVFADYMDGLDARLWRVSLEFQGQGHSGTLRISRADDKEIIIWPLRDVRLIPDQAARDSLIIGRAGDDPARIKIKDWNLRKHLVRICPDLQRRHRDPEILKRLAKLLTVAVASVALMVFVLIPVLANQLALLMPAKSEQAFGDATYDQIRKALRKDGETAIVAECSESRGLEALGKMTARLARGAGLAVPLRLHVLNFDLINAFALPGGHIVLFKGLLEDARSAEEVAAVLAHEMGHVARRDPTRLALRSAGSVGVLGLLFGDFAGGTAVLYLSEKLIRARYSRNAEAKADSFAHETLAASGLPSRPMATLFRRWEKKFGNAQGLRSHLADHPDLRGRAQAALAADGVGKDFQPVLTSREWRLLQAVCE
ncbi:MAG: M48 family metallopeptidase [Paracoccaceae bacterium]